MRISFLVVFLFMTLSSISQWQAGLFGGVAHYQGDLVDKYFGIRNTKPAIGVNVRYELTDQINLRLGFTRAKIAGDDKDNEKDYLRARNLNFESNISELSLTGEYSIFNLNSVSWSPYVFAGVAVFRFNPYTESAGQRVYLQPLGTEGQGLEGYSERPYKLTQLAIPVGGGVKYALSDRIQLGLELGFRKVFTDYLDDVSRNYADENELRAARGQIAVDVAYRTDETTDGNPVYPLKGEQRGSPKQQDIYYFTGLHISFRLGEGGLHFLRGNGRYGCPTVKL